ncbi:MAG: zinc-binding dehydrogenase [Actinobacteria bacterium]|nr:zinc-binding dehydrogenase [Actinomycetota bacterium]
MKAIALNGYGFDNVKLSEVEDPRPGAGEVVVRIKAAALNRLDLWTLSGDLKISHEFPHPLGADGAGEIDSVGDDVSNLKPGTPVVINPGISCRGCELCRAGEHSECPRFRILGEHLPGTLAEKVRVPATNVFPFPGHLSYGEAATFGVTYITAYRMLFTRGRLRPGEWVLITGIGGGLAQSLFQLARPVAGRVYVTSSSDGKLKRATDAGADAAINYRSEDVGKTIRGLTGKRGVDMVVDSAGGESLIQGLRSLRKGGRVVIAGATAGSTAKLDLDRLFWNQLQVIGSTMGSDADVSDMLRLVGGMKLRPVVERTFTLDQGVEALRHLDSDERFGKIVVEVL